MAQSCSRKGGSNSWQERFFKILVGVAAIVLGFTADEFYPSFMRRPGPDEKHLPKWLGRTTVAVVGVGFILSGLSGLRHRPLRQNEYSQHFCGFATRIYTLEPESLASRRLSGSTGDRHIAGAVSQTHSFVLVPHRINELHNELMTLSV